MIVSFHLGVSFVIAVGWTCLQWAELWHQFREVTARLWVWPDFLVESWLLGALMLCPNVAWLLSCCYLWFAKVWTNMLCQSFSAYSGIWVTPWAWISALALNRNPCALAGVQQPALCLKPSGNKEWVLFPLLLSRSCQTTLKTFMRKCSEHREHPELHW